MKRIFDVYCVGMPVWGVVDALAARPAQPTTEGMPMAAMPCKI